MLNKIYMGAGQLLPIDVPTVESLNLYNNTPKLIDQYVAQYPELNKIASQPGAIWMGDWVPEPQNGIASDKQKAGSKTLLYTLYAIPFRDNGNYSAGGFQSDAEYETWINKIATAIGTAKAIIIMEPDALGLASNLDAAARTRRYNLIANAVTRLKQCPNLKLYLDMGVWVEPADAANRLEAANVSTADGVAINTSAFNTTSYCFSRGDSYIDALTAKGITGKRYVIDTSRNGNGPLTASYPGSEPWISRNETWANPPGRALGYTPRLATEYNKPKCYALLWVKTVGSSDATFPKASENSIFTTDAPIPGTIWPEWARHICNNTP